MVSTNLLWWISIYSMYLIVPVNMITSWGMIESRDRMTLRGMVIRSTSSIRIFPWLTDIMWNRDITRDDFPLPVLPQIPICRKELSYKSITKFNWEFTNNIPIRIKIKWSRNTFSKMIRSLKITIHRLFQTSSNLFTFTHV